MSDVKGDTFSFRVTEGLRDALQQMAKEQERSVGWLVRAAIEMYIEREGDRKRNGKKSQA